MGWVSLVGYDDLGGWSLETGNRLNYAVRHSPVNNVRWGPLKRGKRSARDEAPSGETGRKERSSDSRVVELFKRFGSEVHGFLKRRMGDPEEAKEATQEVFLRMWEKERRGELDERAPGYLFKAAENIAHDSWRRAFARARDRHDSVDDFTLYSDLPVEEEAVHWQMGLDMMVNSVSELPESTQQIFSLYHGSRLNYKEIASELGLGIRTVERHMAVATNHCKDKMRVYFEEY